MGKLALVVVLGCGSGTSSVDAHVDPEQCEAIFVQSIERSCAGPSDCVLMVHPDCCGDVEIGVSTSGQAAATFAEATYAACENAACGARGCQHATIAEDGMVPTSTQSFVAVCVAQLCTSTVQ